MTEKQIDALLSDIVYELDYDLWKELFEYNEEDTDAEQLRAILQKVVRKHIRGLENPR